MQGATLGGPGWWFGLVSLLGTRLGDHLAVRHARVFCCPCARFLRASLLLCSPRAFVSRLPRRLTRAPAPYSARWRRVTAHVPWAVAWITLLRSGPTPALSPCSPAVARVVGGKILADGPPLVRPTALDFGLRARSASSQRVAYRCSP